MQARTLWMMLGMMATLGAFIFFFEKDLPSTDERAELEERVFSLEADDIESIEIVSTDSRVVLTRGATEKGSQAEETTENAAAESSNLADWRMTEPYDSRADSTAINSLVDSLIGLKANRTISEFSTAELGLDEPRASVKLLVGSNETILDVGSEVPASSDVIIAVSGQARAFQVEGGFVTELSKEPGQWRAKDLFAHSRTDITQIRLSSDDHELLLAKRGDEFWLEDPLIDRADETAMNTLISDLTGLRASRFVDQPMIDPQTLGLAPPLALVEVIMEGTESPFRLELGLPEDDGSGRRFARIDDQIVTTETNLFDSIEKTASSWRSRSWTNAQVFEIESAAFTDDKGVELIISRDGPDWKRGDDRIEYTVVSDLLYPITELEGTDVFSVEDTDSREGIRRLEVELVDGEHEQSLELLELEDGRFVATDSEREAIMAIDSDKVEHILSKLAAVSSAKPMVDDDTDGAPQNASDPDSIGHNESVGNESPVE